MRKISDTFEEIFAMPLPAGMLSGDNLVPIGLDLKPHREIQPDDAWLLASDIAVEKPLPVVMSFMDSFAFAPEGYYFIGFYERGINNCDFFYSRVDSWRKVYFRLNYGGVYVDGERERNFIREFIPRYFAFEEKLCGKVRSLEVVEASDFSQYTIVLTNDQVFTKTYKYHEALLYNPDFEIFHDVMSSI